MRNLRTDSEGRGHMLSFLPSSICFLASQAEATPYLPGCPLACELGILGARSQLQSLRTLCPSSEGAQSGQTGNRLASAWLFLIRWPLLGLSLCSYTALPRNAQAFPLCQWLLKDLLLSPLFYLFFSSPGICISLFNLCANWELSKLELIGVGCMGSTLHLPHPSMCD